MNQHKNNSIANDKPHGLILFTYPMQAVRSNVYFVISIALPPAEQELLRLM